MALFIQNDDDRTELQKRIAAEIQQRNETKPKLEDLPDGVNDSQYLKGTKKTTKLAWIWIVVILIIIGVVIISTILNQTGRS
jgi:hypothetical protein